MLHIIHDLPAAVLGIRASGTVTGRDYQDVLVPEIEGRLARQPKLRLLYVLGPDFAGFSADAAWEDTKVGLRHFTRFERIAVVTDADWIRSTVGAIGVILPAEVRVYAVDELDPARAWVCRMPG